MIKFAGGATYPLDVLSAQERRRWDMAQSRLANARTGPQRTIANVEIRKVAKDAAVRLAPMLILKGAYASHGRSLLGLGLELKK
jgi:hypothetical protein